MPRSGARVAYLLLALALVQIICPLLFSDGVQWTVSAGVGLGYGWTLFRTLRQRLKTNAL
jgi:positive regulator of sigma E activity